MSSPGPRRAFVLGSIGATSFVATLACGHRASRLEGRWHGVRAEGVAAEMQSAANTFASGMELDVKGDRLTVTTPKEKQTGRYTIIRDEGRSLAIATDKDGPGDPHTFTFFDPDTMKWAVGEGKTIVFARQ